MKRQSAHIPALTPRAKHAMRNECVFAGRLAAGFRLLPLTNASRKLKARTGQKTRRVTSKKSHKPTRSVSMLSRNYFRLAEKISCTAEDKK